MKRFIVVAQDIGVAGPLADICDEIEKRGGECLRLLRESLPDNFEWFLDGPSKPDLVVCGMSSFADRAVNEIRAAEAAIARGIPVWLFADVESTIGRPHFQRIRPRAAGFIVPNSHTAEAVRTAYPTAAIINEGNPDDEKNFHPKVSRAKARTNSGVPDRTAMVVAPLGKDLAVNRLMLVCTRDALLRLNRPFLLFVSLHKDDPHDPPAYEDLFIGDITVSIYRAITKETIPAADLVVASASGESKRAGRLHIPVLNCFTRKALARLAKSTGSDQWPEAVQGVEAEVRPQGEEDLPTAEAVAEMMRKLLDRELDLRPKQAEAYPEPERGIAGRIAGELLQLA